MPRAIIIDRLEGLLRFLSVSDLSYIATICLAEMQDRDEAAVEATHAAV